MDVERSRRVRCEQKAVGGIDAHALDASLEPGEQVLQSDLGRGCGGQQQAEARGLQCLVLHLPQRYESVPSAEGQQDLAVTAPVAAHHHVEVLLQRHRLLWTDGAGARLDPVHVHVVVAIAVGGHDRELECRNQSQLGFGLFITLSKQRNGQSGGHSFRVFVVDREGEGEVGLVAGCRVERMAAATAHGVEEGDVVVRDENGGDGGLVPRVEDDLGDEGGKERRALRVDARQREGERLLPEVAHGMRFEQQLRGDLTVLRDLRDEVLARGVVGDGGEVNVLHVRHVEEEVVVLRRLFALLVHATPYPP